MPRRSSAALVRTLVVAALVSASPPSFLSAQSATYSAIVEQYRRGEYEQAMGALNALSAREVQRSVSEIRAGFLGGGRLNRPMPSRVFVEAALLLHTHADVLSLPRYANTYSFAASTLLDALIHAKTPADYTFLRCWYLFLISYSQGHGRLETARALLDSAPSPVGEHPDMALAEGALHEMGWTLDREGNDVGFSPDLRIAEQAYRRALAAVPAFDEAQVRLGRVLTLRGDLDAAAAALANLRAQAEPGYHFLMHLFAGDLDERRGNVGEARRSYEDAISILPRAQSARVALALLEHDSGARRDAADRIREATAPGAPDSVDPWLWYGKGMAWRTDGYLAAMQGLVKP